MLVSVRGVEWRTALDVVDSAVFARLAGTHLGYTSRSRAEELKENELLQLNEAVGVANRFSTLVGCHGGNVVTHVRRPNEGVIEIGDLGDELVCFWAA